MTPKIFKKLIAGLVTTSLIAAPLFLVPREKAMAQDSTPGYALGGANIGGSFNAQGIGVIAMQIPGCREAIGDKFVDLFAALGNDKAITAKVERELAAGESLASEAEKAARAAESVPVDIGAILSNKIINTEFNTKKTSKDTTELKTEKCWDALGTAAIKQLAQKLTFSIINWINTGYHGAPFFLENPRSFFTDLAKEQIFGFKAELSDPNLYPFGKAFMQGVIQSFQNKFEQNAQYSLNNMIQASNPYISAVNFQSNFSDGGWNAWLGMTQYPQNNPVGFNIAAANTLSIRLNGSINQAPGQELARELLQGGGYLGDEQCVDPVTNPRITREEHRRALNGEVGYKKCNRFEYVTPGQLIGSQIAYAANGPMRQYDLADTLGASLGAILDAVLNQFVTNLSAKGLAKLNTPTGYQPFDTTTLGGGPAPTFFDQFTPAVYQSNTWFQSHPYFDLRVDLTQAFIDEQKTFVEKLEEQNVNLNELITRINQLDYCIPGPHFGWEEEALRNLQAHFSRLEDPEYIKDNQTFLQSVNPISGDENALGNYYAEQFAGLFSSTSWSDATIRSDFKSLDLDTVAFGASLLSATVTGATIGAVIGSAIPGLGTAVGLAVGASLGAGVGVVVGLIKNIHQNNTLGNAQKYKMVVSQIFDRYIQSVNYIFNDKTLSTLPVKQARDEYNRIIGYRHMIEDNGNKISSVKDTIRLLEKLKNEIETTDLTILNDQQLANKMSQWIKKFAPLTENLVDGDDIELENNFNEQIIDRQSYIYEGPPNGPSTGGLVNECEQNLDTLAWQIKGTGGGTHDVQRYPYPFPILYKYGEKGWGELIKIGVPKGSLHQADIGRYDISTTPLSFQSPATNEWLYDNQTKPPGFTDDQLYNNFPNNPGLFNYTFNGYFNVSCKHQPEQTWLLDKLIAPTFIDVSYLGYDCGGSGKVGFATKFGELLKVY